MYGTVLLKWFSLKPIYRLLIHCFGVTFLKKKIEKALNFENITMNHVLLLIFQH